ncbi:MAG: type II secretion system F family protein [Spirochaetes bacterium]|nr:type II secretion system F family protein [Spirochaetota bacterium]
MIWMKLGILLFSFLAMFMGVYYLVDLYSKKRKKAVKPKKAAKKIPGKRYQKYNQFITVFPHISYKQYILVKYGLGLFIFFFLTSFINIIFGGVGFIIGVKAPDIITGFIHRKRINKFELQLVDGLGMIANALKAGSSFFQAVEVMVNELKPPISKVFGDFLKEVRMGASNESALDNLASRIDSEELKIATVSINIAREAGGNLSEILFHISDTIRERERIKRKIDALTSQGKMSGIVVGSMPLLLAVVLYKLDPEMMGPLFSSFLGQVVLLFVMIMITVGFVWIRRIITIDV